MRSNSSPPAAYSMPMPRCVLVRNTSLKRMMLGCSSERWLISSRSTFLRRARARARARAVHKHPTWSLATRVSACVAARARRPRSAWRSSNCGQHDGSCAAVAAHATAQLLSSRPNPAKGCTPANAPHTQQARLCVRQVMTRHACSHTTGYGPAWLPGALVASERWAGALVDLLPPLDEPACARTGCWCLPGHAGPCCQTQVCRELKQSRPNNVWFIHARRPARCIPCAWHASMKPACGGACGSAARVLHTE
jgi:hypothetical protein